MSPSLASSDSHGGHSNTSSPSGAHHTCDTLPMTLTASYFESTIGASGQDVSFFPCREPSMRTAPQLSARWSKLAPPSELPHSLAASRIGERTTPSATGISPFSSNLAVPVQTYGRVGSPFDLSPSPSIHSNGHSDLGTLDQHPSTYAAFLLMHSRVVKVSLIGYGDSVGQPS